MRQIRQNHRQFEARLRRPHRDHRPELLQAHHHLVELNLRVIVPERDQIIGQIGRGFLESFRAAYRFRAGAKLVDARFQKRRIRRNDNLIAHNAPTGHYLRHRQR